MAEIVQHPAAPSETDVSRETVDEIDEPLDAEALAFETRKLIRMLDDEIGRRWCSIALRLQLEAIEVLIGDRGFGA